MCLRSLRPFWVMMSLSFLCIAAGLCAQFFISLPISIPIYLVGPLILLHVICCNFCYLSLCHNCDGEIEAEETEADIESNQIEYRSVGRYTRPSSQNTSTQTSTENSNTEQDTRRESISSPRYGLTVSIPPEISVQNPQDIDHDTGIVVSVDNLPKYEDLYPQGYVSSKIEV